MKLLGQGIPWTELNVGDQFKTFGRTITETDIVSFINCTGFLEVLFTDAEFRAKHSAIAGRVAPAALIFSMAEGLLMVGLIQGVGLAFLNMELDVKGPVVAGDTVHVEVTVTEIRPTSKGGRGLVRTRNEIKNQRGETVIVYTPLRLVKVPGKSIKRRARHNFMFELYFFPTPNSRKITILLEECGAPYELKIVDLGKGDQFHPDFLRISPNNRMPALIDTAPKGGGKPVSIFESGAIMMYVAEKLKRFWPQDIPARYEVAQWMFWQMANQGPKMGEQGHFQREAARDATRDLSYPINRFDNEVHRLFGVLNLGLFEKDWLAAAEYTIADMICYPWAALWKSRGIDIAEFPNVERWLEAIAARPAVQRSGAIRPDLYQGQDKMPLEERERFVAMLSNQRATPIPPEWSAKTEIAG